MENIAIALQHVSDKQLLEERKELQLEIINWVLEYDLPENSSVEKLAISTTIAALRVHFAILQRVALERCLYGSS